jgi:hypothetical protein
VVLNLSYFTLVSDSVDLRSILIMIVFIVKLMSGPTEQENGTLGENRYLVKFGSLSFFW